MAEQRTLPAPQEINKIACLMLNGIGDILCVTPTLEALKERYPEARITMMIRQHLRALVEGSPFVDELIFYDTSTLWKRLVFLRKIRKQRFDLWVDLHVPTFNTVSSNERDFFRNAMLMRASGSTYQLAYAVPQLKPYLSHPVPIPQGEKLTKVNIVDTTLALINPEPDRRYLKHIPVSEVERAWAENILPPTERPRIALFFGSRQSANIWPDKNILEFISLLLEEIPEAELVLIGGEHEARSAQMMTSSLSEQSQSRVQNLICKASLGQTAALLKRCQAMVSTDSGPMHIADAVAVPIVALFTSKNYLAIWRPIGNKAVLVNHEVDCGPCFQADCHLGNKCMALITPREVLDALLHALKN